MHIPPLQIVPLVFSWVLEIGGAVEEGPRTAVGGARGKPKGEGVDNSRGSPYTNGACYAKDSDVWRLAGCGFDHTDGIHCFYF